VGEIKWLDGCLGFERRVAHPPLWLEAREGRVPFFNRTLAFTLQLRKITENLSQATREQKIRVV
jgi:hypothetical protein